MPNVILLMSDEHNPLYSSVHGHPFVHTPNMERMAQVGTVYENTYCASPLCVPARSAFMSGRLVHDIQIFNNCKVIEADYPTYGGVLAEQGVHTTYVGSASNLYRNPFEFGFSEMLLVKRTEKSLARDFTRHPVPMRDTGVPKTGYGPKPGVWDNDSKYVSRAIQWLRETAPTLDKPWTLTVNVHAPHPPMFAEPAFWEMYKDHADLPRYGTEQESAQHPYACDLRRYQRTAEVSETQIRGLRQGYYAGVTHVDYELGRLIDAWEELGLQNDTIIAYTTDHGEMLGKFGMWWKSSMYEDSVRIPLLVAGPGFGKGQRVKTPVSSLDLQAAMFRAVGKERPAEWAGTALQDVPTYDAERVAFSEYHAHGLRGGAFMVRRGDWKLIYNMDAPHQLFNLQDDPDELRNLWGKEEAVGRSLEAALRSICNLENVDEQAHARERRQLEIIDELTA